MVRHNFICNIYCIEMKFLLGWEYKMFDEGKISEQLVYFQFSKLHGKSFSELGKTICELFYMSYMCETVELFVFF